MDSVLKTVAEAAMNRLADHVAVVGLWNTDEFAFRSFFLYELMKVLPSAQCETEWQRFDLLVRERDRNTLLEFKYYLHRRSTSLSGFLASWKGDAGVQNRREFSACIEKLHTCPFEPIHAKYMVLVYERTNPRTGSTNCFSQSYGTLPIEGPLTAVTDIQHKLDDSVACRLFRIA
jgi:hypothetical protein